MIATSGGGGGDLKSSFEMEKKFKFYINISVNINWKNIYQDINIPYSNFIFPITPTPYAFRGLLWKVLLNRVMLILYQNLSITPLSYSRKVYLTYFDTSIHI